MRFSSKSLMHAVARCAVAATLLQSLTIEPLAAQIQSKVLATVGSAAPAGGNYQAFTSVSMNGSGQLTFNAGLSGTSSAGIFLMDRSTTSAVALAGPAASGAFNFLSLGAPAITANGDVLFTSNAGLFRSRGESLIPVAQNGEALPGVGRLTPELLSVGSGDRVAFSAAVNDGLSASGIFRTGGGVFETIVRDQTTAPTGGTFDSFNGFVINQRGQVAFEAVMVGGSVGFGVFRTDGEETTAVFASNQIAPGGGLFSDFSDPVINARGEIAVVGAPLQNTTSNFGVFLNDGRQSKAIALDGHPAPNGGNYNLGTFAPLVLNDQSQLLFNVGLTGGAARSGIFRSKGDDVETIALQGSPAPGTTGTFASFQNMKMLNDGRFVFVAQLTVGGGGVGFANNVGIWVGTSREDLQLLARSGDTVDGIPVCVPPRPDQFDFNEGSVAWISQCPRRSGTALILSTFDTSNRE